MRAASFASGEEALKVCSLICWRLEGPVAWVVGLVVSDATSCATELRPGISKFVHTVDGGNLASLYMAKQSRDPAPPF